MRYILAYPKLSQEVRNALAKLSKGGVELELVRGNEPDEEQVTLLLSAELVYCVSVRKKLRKGLQRLGVSVLSFESLNAVIAEIEREDVVEKNAECPSVVLKQFGESLSGNVLFAEDWDRYADEITAQRWMFVSEAVSALIEYAANPAVASHGLDQYFSERGLKFATNGKVEVSYRVVDAEGKLVVSNATKWHLKEGDKTTAEDAARIYFATENVGKRWLMIMLRVGPHPSGPISVDVPLSD
ncbi:MAG: hypothetical protein H7A48_06760 [Akkermansiaceae bacterium]|nr:hypothetical protein [Akkermansiaceae bacterium]